MVSEITKIKRRVLTDVAALTLSNKLEEEIDNLPKKLVREGIAKYRCCEFKERAILTDRVRLALGLGLEESDEDEPLALAAKEALTEDLKKYESHAPLVSIIEKACDRCPIERIVVTDACRNCVAHYCVNACPKNAMQIVGNQVYINRDLCVECGLCVKACHFGAIIIRERPCSKACGVGAISPSEDCSARIDYEKCIECGACISACPFGAISDRSDIVRVIRMLKDRERKIHALVAPSVVGQFGPMVEWTALEKGLKELGFDGVFPVAIGADMVAERESQELIERRTHSDDVIFNSCCPAFKRLVNLKFPELSNGISSTPSPMLVAAEVIKEKDRDVRCVFIGPCVGKKGEALKEGDGLIDAVLTFEEMAALLVAAGINLAQMDAKAESQDREASSRGIGFCKAGGVADAISSHIESIRPDLQVRTESVCGVDNCIKMLKLISKGGIQADFLEGMACDEGCIGGPGRLVDAKVSSRALQRLFKARGDANG